MNINGLMRIRDPGSGMEKIRIRDGKNSDPGSGVSTWRHGTRPRAAAPPPGCRPSRPGSPRTSPPKIATSGVKSGS
jgi:hypothetical protein